MKLLKMFMQTEIVLKVHILIILTFTNMTFIMIYLIMSNIFIIVIEVLIARFTVRMFPNQLTLIIQVS